MRLPATVRQFFDLEKSELRIVGLSAAYFFLLLCAYYILRPIRETMGISRSADDLPYLFLATMLSMLLLAPVIGALVSKYPRNQFIPYAYRFISINLLLFFAALQWLPTQQLFAVGIVFYIWLSIINLLLISLFWGFMSDGIAFRNSKRLFPGIAVGGTIGAIFGSSIAQQFIELLGQAYMLLVSIFFLEAALRVMKIIDREFSRYAQQPENQELKSLPEQTPENRDRNRLENSVGSKLAQWFSGVRYTFSSPYVLAIAGYIFFYGLTSTFLYFQQGQLVAAETGSSSERTQIFANIDLWANSLTLIMQLLVSRQLLMRFGIGTILVGLPLITLAGFIALSISPVLSVLIVFQALRRSLNYGLFKPAREILFTVLPTEQKYKAKSFVDTFVYRGGDAVGALSQKGLLMLQLGIASIAMLVVPIAALWALLAIYLGGRAKRLDSSISIAPGRKSQEAEINASEKDKSEKTVYTTSKH